LTGGGRDLQDADMKAKIASAVSVSLLLISLGLFMAGAVCPPASAVEVAVQPGGRIEGQWVTEKANMIEYLDAILLPASAQCSQFEGYLCYNFQPGEAPTLMINGYGLVIHLVKGRSGPGRADRISFGMGISYQAPYSINASEQILEFGAPSPDVSSVTIDNLTINDVEVMRESGDVSMLGLPLSFVATRMRFEFVGNDHLKLTPIFPPAADGVNIEPRPLILRRK
jgi:hypothetical protein